MTSVRFMAVGDIMLGDHPLSVGRGVASVIEERGVDHPFSGVVGLLRSADLAFGNLEAVLSSRRDSGASLSSVTMIGKPSAAEGLANAGFGVVSVANNHMFDHGTDAFLETLAHLSKNGIKHVGFDTHMRPDANPLLLTHRDIRIALLAYCLIPGKGNAGIFARENAKICDEIAQARNRADVVVVSIHWGDEYLDRPSPSQIRLAHRMIDSGATVVLGHHPHVLQGVERYHQGLIAYSLGNFVFDLDFLERAREGIILECELTREGVISHSLHPVHINSEHAPRILEGVEKNTVLERLNELSNRLETESILNAREESARYTEKVRDVRRCVQRRMTAYFLLNIFRYPPRFSFEMASGFANKMVRKVVQ